MSLWYDSKALLPVLLIVSIANVVHGQLRVESTRVMESDGLVLDFSWHPNGSHLLVHDGEGQTARAVVWDADERAVVFSREHMLYSFAELDAAAERIATPERNGTVHIWDINSGEKTSTFRDEHSTVAPSRLRWSPCGDWLFAGYRARMQEGYGGHTALIWNVRDPSAAPHVLDGHTNQNLRAAWSPSGEHIAVHTGDRVRIWALAGDTFEPLENASLGSPVARVLWSPDGRHIAVDGTARIWSPAEQRLVQLRVHSYNEGRQYPRLRDWHQDGTRLLTTAGDRARIWQVISDGALVVDPPYIELRHGAPVRWAHFSRNGDHVLTISPEAASAVLWDATTGERLIMIDDVVLAALDPLSRRIIVVDDDRQARIVNARDGATLATLDGHKVYGCWWNADGTRLATVVEDNRVLAWEIDEQ